MEENEAISRARRVRTLLTREHDEHDQNDDDDHDEDENEGNEKIEAKEEEEKEEEEEERDEGNVKTNDSARGSRERCIINNHTPASNRPGHRTGWRGVHNCHRKQVVA